MASSFLKGLVTDYGKLGYQLWHRPLKMASLVYEREIGFGATSTVVACCELFSVASYGQVYSRCAVQRTVNVLAFCDFIN